MSTLISPLRHTRYLIVTSPDLTYSNNYPPRVLDGDLGTWWQPVGTDAGGSGTRTIRVDLATPISLRSIRAVAYSTQFQFIDYTIQTWNGTAWVIVATVVGNTVEDTTDLTGGVTSDRFRIVATAWNSANPAFGCAIREITWNDGVAWSPDVIYGDSNVAALAVDGNTATWWQTVATGGSSRTIRIDLGGLVDLTNVRTQWYDVNYRFIDYVIENSSDGIVWNQVIAVTGNALDDRTDSFTTTSTRYFRIVASAWTPNTGSPGPALRELTWS